MLPGITQWLVIFYTQNSTKNLRQNWTKNETNGELSPIL